MTRSIAQIFFWRVVYFIRYNLNFFVVVVNAIIWVLRTGAPWASLPRRYLPYETCHR